MMILPVLLVLAVLSPANSRSAKEKFDGFVAGRVPPGTAVVFTEDEINSYLRYDYASEMPPGLSDPHIRFEPDRVVGDVLVDFVEWRSATGVQPNWLLSWLLRGKRRVDVTARFTSWEGNGQVDLESVEIEGVPISASAVRFLIENVVQPRYPEAVVGRPVPLGYRLKQVRIEPGRAVAQTRGRAQGKR
jgi:hypothetical protein